MPDVTKGYVLVMGSRSEIWAFKTFTCSSTSLDWLPEFSPLDTRKITDRTRKREVEDAVLRILEQTDKLHREEPQTFLVATRRRANSLRRLELHLPFFKTESPAFTASRCV
ncbi:hypothetical protein EYF80_034328 [Liparis tanakae]|uniref:Uncharacterized protein n=1 Tax=Liparis tanakae TaxID=230148 RepID=A0A4Z2GPU0_9TELE|nr:hypothetical protein EYF80_034328 [Liparis tanakae]